MPSLITLVRHGYYENYDRVNDRRAEVLNLDGEKQVAKADDIAQIEQTQNFQSPSPFYYPEQYLQIDTSDQEPAIIASEILHWLNTDSTAR